MALSIKNKETQRLAQQLSQLTGESLTGAITQALRERLDRLQFPEEKERLVAQLLAIGDDCAKRLKPPYDRLEHGDLLFDERGLPK
jgi:antitoxin VapB